MFPGVTFLKRYLEFSRRLGFNQKTHEFSRRRHNSIIRIHVNFQKNVLEHIKISRRAAFSIFRKNTYDFPGGRNIIRTDQIFQEILSKISLEHIRFSRRKNYHKNISNFPGGLSQNFVRTDTIFQETLPTRTDILQNCLEFKLLSNTSIETHC